jgi:predicted aminopeptidase
MFTEIVRNCVLISIFMVAGCAGPAFYTQAISGHLELMNGRTEINAILADNKTDPALQQRLKLAMEIRSFAIEQLGLPDNGSYTEFVQTGRPAVTWNVVAAPEFSIEPKRWCFIVSGCVSYRGYFEQHKAVRFSNKLEKKSYDVTVSPAIAYSTLGWFDDPLLDTMLQYQDDQLAAVIFHELAHQQLYVKGDTEFSESYASFVEETGVREWLKSRGSEKLLARRQAMNEASTEFNELIRITREQLNEVYTSGIGEEAMRKQKKAVLTNMELEYQLMVDASWGGQNHYRSWFTRELNNAQLALINLYQGGGCAFDKLYESAGGNMLLFQQLAAGRGALSKQKRAAWLNQPCDLE